MPLDFSKMDSMAGTISRFKVADGEINVPVLVLRHPDDDSIATKHLKKHWLDKPDGGSIIIPCASMAGKPCSVDAMREAYQATGMYSNADKDTKKFLDGNVTHETQLIDLRGNGLPLVQKYLAAMQSRDAAVAVVALDELHNWMLNEPVKIWGYSRTVYEIISRKIRESMTEFGKLIDPTEASEARIFWVSKPKQAQGTARFDVAVKWSMAIPIPLKVYDRVKKYDEIYSENTEGCVFWDARRVHATLLENGYQDMLQNAGTAGLPLPVAQAAMQLSTPQTLRLPPSQTPVAQQPIVIEATAIEVQAGATVSAADMPCFGVSPNLASQQCNSCPQVDACLTATRAKMAKPTAPAMAAAIQMPKADPAPAADAGNGDRIKNLVAQAMAKINNGKAS